MKYPVTFQIPVRVADGAIWCYEKKSELPIPPFTGLLLVGYVPNVLGPSYQADNGVRRIVLRENRDLPLGAEICCSVQGFQDATMTVEEMDDKLRKEGWERHPDVLQRSPLETGRDPLDEMFNGP